MGASISTSIDTARSLHEPRGTRELLRRRGGRDTRGTPARSYLVRQPAGCESRPLHLVVGSSFMRPILLSLLLLSMGCQNSKTAGSGGIDAATSLPTSVAVEAAPRVDPWVCVFSCSGPLPVDAQGMMTATVRLTLETTQPTLTVEMKSLELQQASGARVAGMLSASAWISGNFPFTGNVPDGGRVNLLGFVRLDATQAALVKTRPVAFAGEVLVSGVSVPIKGAISSGGSTG